MTIDSYSELTARGILRRGKRIRQPFSVSSAIFAYVLLDGCSVDRIGVPRHLERGIPPASQHLMVGWKGPGTDLRMAIKQPKYDGVWQERESE